VDYDVILDLLLLESRHYSQGHEQYLHSLTPAGNATVTPFSDGMDITVHCPRSQILLDQEFPVPHDRTVEFQSHHIHRFGNGTTAILDRMPDAGTAQHQRLLLLAGNAGTFGSCVVASDGYARKFKTTRTSIEQHRLCTERSRQAFAFNASAASSLLPTAEI